MQEMYTLHTTTFSFYEESDLPIYSAVLSYLAAISVRKHAFDWKEKADMLNLALIILSVCVYVCVPLKGGQQASASPPPLPARLPFSG